MKMIGCLPAEMWKWCGIELLGQGRKTWAECVRKDMELHGLEPECELLTYSGMYGKKCGEM